MYLKVLCNKIRSTTYTIIFFKYDTQNKQNYDTPTPTFYNFA